MRWMLVVPLLTVGAARAAEVPPLPSVTVQGSCTASAPPDRARVFVSAEATGQDAGRTAAAAITQYNRFRAAVDKLALPDQALSSTGVQTERSTDTRGGKLVTTGYTARAGLTVETSSLAGLARVMQEAASEGMADIGTMELFLSDPLHRSLEQSCLPKATADARTRAAALLSGLGASLGPVLSVNEGDQESPGPRPVFAPRMAMMATAAPAPDLSAGPQSVTVSATVTFAIQAAK